MTAFAPWPLPGEVPIGMVLVGWRCTSPDHDCLLPVSRAEPSGFDPTVEVYLRDAQHHASWVPVWARVADLGDVAGAGHHPDLAYGWRCMVCGDNKRSFDKISVARRPPRPQHDGPGIGHWNVSYCNDRPACVAAATAEGPWPPDGPKPEPAPTDDSAAAKAKPLVGPGSPDGGK